MLAKTCAKCKVSKPLDCFVKHPTCKYGVHSRCKDCTRKQVRECYARTTKKHRQTEEGKKRVNATNKRWRDQNKSVLAEKKAAYYRTERGKRIARNNANRHRAAMLQATLPGFEEEIKAVYLRCPDGYHVDHIVPLQGKNVCGLHVPWNLQHLSAKENLQKGNRVDGCAHFYRSHS